MQSDVYQKTWNGVRVTTDFDNPTSPDDHRWKARQHLYKNISRISGHIHVNGKILFSGLNFSAEPSTDNGDNDLGTLELSPREFRIFMNNNGADKVCSFKVKSVPQNYYIWIEAVSNSTTEPLKFSLSGGNNVTATRIDRNDGGAVLGKHMFCYKTNVADDYTITPSRACFLYYVAVVDHPYPLITFSTTTGTIYLTERGYWYPANPGPFTNTATVTFDGTDAPSSVTNKLQYSSDDETVVTVTEDGKITGVGKGIATITATLPEGVEYTFGGKTYKLEHPCSASYTVEVVDDRVVYTNLASGKTPTLWEQIPITEISNSYYENRTWGATYRSNPGNDIKLYLGGWKYQSGSTLANVYNKTISGYKYGDSSGESISDAWQQSKIYQVGYELPVDYQAEPIDQYDVYTLGDQNAKCEFMYTDKLLAGDYVLEFDERHPGVDWKTVDKTGDYTQGKGNPFTVPCFGTFLKIEPDRNGQVTVYILQNGVREYNSNNNNHLVGSLGWRSVYIVDEAGNRLSDNDVKAVTKQRTMVSYNDETSDVYDKNDNLIYKNPDGTFTTTKTQNNEPATYIDYIQNYRDPTTDEWMYNSHRDIYSNTKYWGRRGGSEIVLGPEISGDGWVVMTKGYVKYQFDVKAGKTYYLFANKSAIGFCGATFLPDSERSGKVANTASCTLNAFDGNNTTDGLANILGNNESVTIDQVNVYHNFHKGWNSICLPFSITESKMREIFGKKTITSGWSSTITKNEDYEVLLFNGCTEETDADGNKADKVHFFHHVYQDIIAGYPYMIYIPEDADILKNYSGYFTVNNVTIEKANLANLPTITTSRQYMPVGSGFEDHAEKGDFTFTGVYKPTPILRGSYCIVKDGIQIYDAVTLPGYRAYLHPTYLDKGTSNHEIKRITATNLNEMTYIWDEANPIKSIFVDGMSGNGLAAPSDVYSVSGVLVRKNSTSLEGLPKGIYIVNGKKCFVK